MNYPLISEYIEAIKSAEENFDQLTYLRPVLDENEEPVISSGNFPSESRFYVKNIYNNVRTHCHIR